jgi:hypothetical protein
MHSVLVLLAITLGGCVTAQPIVRLSPRAPASEVAWLAGVPIVGKSGQHSRVAVAFAREAEGKIGLRVEVQNRGEKNLLLDSRNFSYRICHRVAEKGETCGKRFLVVDPEAEILAMEIQRRREQAANANEETFHTAMALLSLTGQIASAASGDHHASNHASANTNYFLNQAKAATANEQYQMSAFELARSNWELHAFRKTTTPPGQAVAGLVFVDRDPRASAVMLYATIDDEFYSFPFDQTVIHPNRPNHHASPPRLR